MSYISYTVLSRKCGNKPTITHRVRKPEFDGEWDDFGGAGVLYTEGNAEDNCRNQANWTMRAPNTNVATVRPRLATNPQGLIPPPIPPRLSLHHHTASSDSDAHNIGSTTIRRSDEGGAADHPPFSVPSTTKKVPEKIRLASKIPRSVLKPSSIEVERSGTDRTLDRSAGLHAPVTMPLMPSKIPRRVEYLRPDYEFPELAETPTIFNVELLPEGLMNPSELSALSTEQTSEFKPNPVFENRLIYDWSDKIHPASSWEYARWMLKVRDREVAASHGEDGEYHNIVASPISTSIHRSSGGESLLVEESSSS